MTRAWQRFWFELPTTWDRMAWVRLCVFGVIALEAWTSLVHAPRYGAGDFNVSHFPALDPWLPVPGRRAMVVLWVAQGYLALRIALGTAGRSAVVTLTVLYAATHFASQLDSYQHHYLILWVLALWSTLPGELVTNRHGAWQRRLILGVLSIVYLWAAYSKLDPLWSSGAVLGLQLDSGAPLVRTLTSWTGSRQAALLLLARATIATEIFLAVALWFRRLWPLAWIAGVVFHAGIELLGFRIELFSYLMVALYFLVAPEPVIRLVTAPLRAIAGRFPRPYLPLTGHAIACASLLLLGATTSVALDHHRYLGGDSRRRGDLPAAIRAYEKVIAIDPTYEPGHRRLEQLHRLAR